MKIYSYPLEYVDYFLLNEIEAKDLTGFDVCTEKKGLKLMHFWTQYAAIFQTAKLC